ncbi:hypothetical protein [Streptomyces sp. HUCO-GS316]|uniref:hypothetical protein n=1 Tax=Streptomyces sp. HUCO-GS316 TaxID=2692198 RepID=UPI001F45341A|nr:hypothetical protein [Streptomyces sp. HUCO-GS316]
MLDEVATLAAAGSAAVIAAAGTDAWQELRQTVARWVGRGDSGREQRELERLDRTADALRTGGPDEADVRISEQSAWQTRFEMVLEDMNDGDRDRAVEQLRALLAATAASPAARAGDSSMVVGGNANIQARDGGFAAGVVKGEVHINTPPQPEPTQG